MVSKRPFKFTTQEYATVFFLVGIMIIIVSFIGSFDFRFGCFIIYPSMLLFFGVGMFFFFLGYTFPCYQISKWELNPYIDRLEPGWTIWLRFTKSRRYCAVPVKEGPLGQTKGIVEGHKADVINRGNFPITLMNGNSAIIKYDLLSHNVSLEEDLGWELINKKHFIFGVNAFKRCIEDRMTVIVEPEKKEAKEEKKK